MMTFFWFWAAWSYNLCRCKRPEPHLLGFQVGLAHTDCGSGLGCGPQTSTQGSSQGGSMVVQLQEYWLKVSL